MKSEERKDMDKRIKILVVDDELPNIQVIQFALMDECQRPRENVSNLAF